MMAGFASGVICNGDIYNHRPYFQPNDGRIEYEDPVHHHRQQPYGSTSTVYSGQVPHHIQSPQVEGSPWREGVHQPYQLTLQYPQTTMMAPLEIHQSFPTNSPPIMSEPISVSTTDVVGPMAMDAGTSVHHTPQGMMRVPDPQAVPYVSIHPEHTPYHKIVTEGSEHQGASPGSVSSPREASIQHHFPVSIDKELLFLNCALSEAFAASETNNTDTLWTEIVGEVFDIYATVAIGNSTNGSSNLHNLSQENILEFFTSLCEGGVKGMLFDYRSIHISHMDNNVIAVSCPKARCLMSYQKPINFEAVMNGHLELQYMDMGLPRPKVKLLKFVIKDHQEFLDRKTLQQSLEPTLSSETRSPIGVMVPSALTVHGLPESTWNVFQKCSSERKDRNESHVDALLSGTPTTPHLHLTTEITIPNETDRGPDIEESSCSPHIEENAIGTQNVPATMHRRSTRSSSAGIEGNSKPKKGKRSTFTILVVEEPVPLSECDVHEDLREIKVERLSNFSIDDEILDIVLPKCTSQGPTSALEENLYGHVH